MRVTGRVYGDESWLDRLRGGPASGFALDYDIGGPLGGLLFNRGLAREDGSALQTQPAKFAATQLTHELRRIGVRVPRSAGEGTRPGERLRRSPTVASPTIATLIRLTLVPSDNLLAEMLLKNVGARFGTARLDDRRRRGRAQHASRRYGVARRSPTAPASRASNGTSPRQVVTLLNGLRANAYLRAALPVAGRSGTLAARMRRTSAQDRCQAKTGTLSNVSALAGYCRTPNGHVLAFAFIENSVYTPPRRPPRTGSLVASSRPSGRRRDAALDAGRGHDRRPADAGPPAGGAAATARRSPSFSFTKTVTSWIETIENVLPSYLSYLGAADRAFSGSARGSSLCRALAVEPSDGPDV